VDFKGGGDTALVAVVRSNPETKTYRSACSANLAIYTSESLWKRGGEKGG